MDYPTSQSGFVKTKDFSTAKEKLNDPDVTAIVFTGPAGSGKSTLAMQLCEYMWSEHLDQNEVNFLFRQFRCKNCDVLYADLRLFYRVLDKPEGKLSLGHPKKWDILETLFRELNSSHPDDFKIFILDDAESVEDVLNIVNHICKVIELSPGLKGRWKFLLTSQKHPAHPGVYNHIDVENFIKIHGFEFGEVKELFACSAIDDADIRMIIDKLGQMPLTLNICLNYLNSNQVENRSQCVRTFLDDIDTQTKVLGEKDSALIPIKVSIERLVEELPCRNESLQVIKMLTLFNEKNITDELLVACAETYIDNPQQVVIVVSKLKNSLNERGICTNRSENKVPLFSLHQLVKQSMKLFVGEEEQISVIIHALVALTRVMPKDGRKHQTRLVGFYGDHGKSLDASIKAAKKDVNEEQMPLIMLLHCSMLTSMGYCHLAQRTGDYKEGVRILKEALNKYCELVLNSDYDSLVPPQHRREDPALVELNIAKRLFEASKNLSLIESQSYKQYIADLPLYHRLTKKDLDNMMEVPSAAELVNEHLTRDDLEKFERKEKVIERDLLAKVYIAEVLAQIYSVWSTVHRKRADYDAARDECIIQAEAAVQIYKRIFEEYKVYLLAGLITEREMLSTKLQAVGAIEQVKEMTSRLEVLSKIGKNPTKKNAYEAGLIRSDLSKDSYHELLCKESAINGKGRLYEITAHEDHYEYGKRLFVEVVAIANSQVYRHSTLSYSHKNYANFLYNCKKYGEAVVSILRAMLELHRSLRNGDSSPGHPEFSHPRFKALYSCLVRYYDKFSASRDDAMKARGEITIRDEEKLLDVDMEECSYLTSAMKCWRDIAVTTGGRLPSAVEPVTLTTSQPTESNNDLQYLETIREREIQDLQMAVEVSAPTPSTQ